MVKSRILVPDGNPGIPEIRAIIAADKASSRELEERRARMAAEFSKTLAVKLGDKTPEELDRVERVWRDPNFQHQIANNPQLVLRWMLVGEGFDKAHHALTGLIHGLRFSLDSMQGIGPDEKIKPHIKTMKTSVGGLNAVITSLNATLASGKAINYSTTKLEDVITGVTEAAYFSSISPGQFKEVTKVVVDIKPDVGRIETDRNRLFLALTNCVTNSVQAIESINPVFDGDKGNSITIRASNVVDGGIDRVRIDVEDNGCGFDPAEKQNIFQYWYTTKGEGGTGLGVPTTRDIVEELGGRFDLNSPGKGKGATATIILPMA